MAVRAFLQTYNDAFLPDATNISVEATVIYMRDTNPMETQKASIMITFAFNASAANIKTAFVNAIIAGATARGFTGLTATNIIMDSIIRGA